MAKPPAARKRAPAQDDEADRARRKSQTLEWAIAICSACLILALIGYLVFEAATRRGGYPVLSAHVEAIVPSGDGYLVAVRVENAGDQTAAAVEVEGRLEAGPAPETSAVTIDYVPQRAHHEAGLVFKADPNRFPLTLRIKGYQNP